MKSEFTKSLGGKIVLFVKSQIRGYTDKNGRVVPTHYDKRTKKGETKHATENRTFDMFADAPVPDPKVSDKKPDWTDPDIFGKPNKEEAKNSSDDWPESFLPKKADKPKTPSMVLREALKRGDLKAALDVITPMQLNDAKDAVLWAGFPMRSYKSKKEMLAGIQSIFLQAAKEGKDGLELREKAPVEGKPSSLGALEAQLADLNAHQPRSAAAYSVKQKFYDDTRKLREQIAALKKPEEKPKESKPIKVTPQVLSDRVADSIISSAAESIATLRRADVGRVLDETPAHYKLAMASHIKAKRRDLSDEVDSVMAEESPATRAPAAPAATPKPAPDNGMVSSGEKLRTVSGRIITAPKIGKSAAINIKKMNNWLHAEATTDAKESGDSWRLTLLNGINPDKTSQSDRDNLNLFVFGDTQVGAENRVNESMAKSETSFDLFLKSHIKQFTRKDGSTVKEHDDKRIKKVVAPPVVRPPAQVEQPNTQAPAKAKESSYGHHNMSEGDSISFKAGDFTGSGKVKLVGQDGATVTDKSGRDHQVHWHEVVGRGEGKQEEPKVDAGQEVKPVEEKSVEEPPSDDHGKQDPKVAGSIGPNTQKRIKAEEFSRALFDTSKLASLPKKAVQSEKFDSWDKINAGAPEALEQFKGMLGAVAKTLDLETGKIPATFDFAQGEEDAKNKAQGKSAEKLNPEKYMTPQHWDNDRGFLFIGPLKKKDRAEAKVKADYTNKETGVQDWTQLKDMVRATIAVPSITQIPKVLAEMRKAGIVLAQQPKNNLTGEGLHDSGYRDLNLIVKMPNGMLAELQIHCKPMTHAKEHGHEYYAANAAIERQYDDKDEERKTWSEEHKKHHAENASKMKKIYDTAWDKMLSSEGNQEGDSLRKSFNRPMMILLNRRVK